VAEIEKNLYQQIAHYLTGSIALRDLRRWFDCESWEHQTESDIIGQVELLFGEYTSRHRTEQDLRQQLEQVIATFTFKSVISPVQATVFISAASSNKTLRGGILAKAERALAKPLVNYA